MKNKWKEIFGLLIIVITFASLISLVNALPTQPTLTLIGNSTKSSSSGLKINYTGNDTNNPNKAGGFIFTINLEGISQNSRWKGFVGNVTGKLTLDDANDYTIYDWTVSTSISGEVYATRASGTINWTNISCANDNVTHWENYVLNHTNANDNISVTFNDTDNSEFYVGNVIIGANTCPTINLHVNDTSDLNDDFEQILLYDGNKGAVENGGINSTNNTYYKNLVYAAIIEEDAWGYRNNGTNTSPMATYDFQMIVPEVGLSSWASSTPYYFYVELT